jgi:hypothetical protein
MVGKYCGGLYGLTAQSYNIEILKELLLIFIQFKIIGFTMIQIFNTIF